VSFTFEATGPSCSPREILSFTRVGKSPISKPFAMCLPACLNHMARLASRRSFLAGSLGIVASTAGGAMAASAPAISGPRQRIVDLTHTLDPDFPTYSGQPQFEARAWANLERDGWNVREWRVDEHTGTHLDAPLHRAAEGISADLIPPERLIGPLAVIDISARAADNPVAEVTPDDVKAWEGRWGPIPDGAIVAMRSGWGAFARTPRYRGADETGALRFPGFHDEAAALLLETRSVSGLIVDTLSLDPGNSKTFPVHTRWLGAGRWGLECAAHLDRLPASGATVIVGAPKVAGATGGPSRVFALV
jgi:kynurenine formamidase